MLALISTRRGGWPWMKEWLSTRLRGLVVPVLSVVTALAIGGLVLIFTDQAVYQALSEGKILEALAVGLANLAKAYGALYEGALGSPLKILEGIFRALSGEGLRPLLGALRGPSDSLVQSVPYILPAWPWRLVFAPDCSISASKGRSASAGWWRWSWDLHSPACRP